VAVMVRNVLRLVTPAIALLAAAASYAQPIGAPVKDPAIGSDAVLVASKIFEVNDRFFRAQVTSNIYQEAGVDGLTFSYSVFNEPKNQFPTITSLQVLGGYEGSAFSSAVVDSAWQTGPQAGQKQWTNVFGGGNLSANLESPGLVTGEQSSTLFIRTNVSDYIVNDGFLRTDSRLGRFDTYAPVPEPGTMLAIGAGAAFLAARRRRKA